MTATIEAMRALVVLALASLAIVVAGCGGSSSSTRADSAPEATLSADAAKLVPAGALAFASVATDRSSGEWQRLDELTRGLPARTALLQRITTELAQHGLSYDRDVAPALGDELDLAVLQLGREARETVAFARPTDEGKLKTLASKFDSAGAHYTVQAIGGWSVVADSDAAFAAVRAASSGRSLADTAAFAAARSQVSGDAIAWYYALGGAAGASTAQWSAAEVDLRGREIRVSGAAAGNVLAAPAVPKHLRDIPAGAALALSFEGRGALLTALRSARLPNVPLAQLAPLVDGGGVAYVRPKGIFPELAVELTPTNPAQALARARALLRSNASQLGPLQLMAQLDRGALVISDSRAAAAALSRGAKLVDEPAFKTALRAAGPPARTSALLYANVSQLEPFLQLGAAAGGARIDPAFGDTLGEIGTLVAWSTRSGGITHFELRAERR